jgi:hypothetical protein
MTPGLNRFAEPQPFELLSRWKLVAARFGTAQVVTAQVVAAQVVAIQHDAAPFPTS